MSVDLRSNTTFERISLVLMDDCLIKLEHERTKDRVRRFMFEGIESVIFWRRAPWVRIALCLVFLVLPGVALFFVGQTFATVMGIILLALGGGLIALYLYCRQTTIRIVRAGGSVSDLTGLFRPGRARRFVDRLVAGVQNAQQAAIQRAAAASPPAAAGPAAAAQPAQLQMPDSGQSYAP